ncbi:MAG: hypothetical protein AAB600_00335 [Patescibacteria group bacterium]
MRFNKSTHIKILIEALFYFSIEVLLTLFFRKIRNLFPIPTIGENKIVGYAQYFGYPFYFDNFVFFLFIISPLLLLSIVTVRRKIFKIKT